MQLIIEAMKHGDRHRRTMELADFWLKEKQAVHKLFKVLVPRFADYTTSFTNLFYLPPRYAWNVPQKGDDVPHEVVQQLYNHKLRGVLEFKGNPYPALFKSRSASSNKTILTNVLMSAAREQYDRAVTQEQQRNVSQKRDAAVDGKSSANTSEANRSS